MASLRNVDLTDRELLHVVADCEQQSDDGTVTALEVALQLGFEINGDRSAIQTVAMRMAWMRRYGYVDKLDPREHEGGKAGDPVRWALTEIGRMIMGGKLSQSLASQVERLQPGQQVLMMRKLTQNAYVEARDEVATAVRREYLHNAAKRLR